MRHFGIAKRRGQPPELFIDERTRASPGIPGPRCPRCPGLARQPAPLRARRSPGAQVPARPLLPPRPRGGLPALRRSPRAEHVCPAPPLTAVRIRGRARPPHGGCRRGRGVLIVTTSGLLGAQEWTQSKTQQEFSQRPLGRIVSLLLNRGLTREVGKGGEQARSPPRAGVPRGRSRTGPKPAPSPDSCVRARGGPTRPRQRWAPGAQRRRPARPGGHLAQGQRAREGHTLPGSEDAGRRGSGEGPIGIDVLTGSASPDDRKRLCVRALGRK